MKIKEDIYNDKYEQLKIFGFHVLFTPTRIPLNLLPSNIHRYEVRHDDEGQGIMCELAKKILVNHWGTVLSKKPIPLDKFGCRIIDEDKDVEYLNKPSISLKEYCQTKQRYRKEAR